MHIRLLADDLTGAIDTAVRFAPLTGPVPVMWNAAEAAGRSGSLALDLGTREMDGAQALSRAKSAAALLADADLAYLKCDSLLRGQAAEEIAACLGASLGAGAFDHCVIAPAFPAQRRVTRLGRQWAAPLDEERWGMVGPDLQAQLAVFGLSVSLGQPGSAAPAGVSLWDAETDQDLRRIADAARALPGRVLWCGTAGLAEVLAGTPPARVTAIQRPFLALIGSDHPMSARQVEAAADWHCILDPQDPSARGALAERLSAMQAVAVTVAVAEGTHRAEAAGQIAHAFAATVGALPQPATLFATGGETLRGICEALEATSLSVHAEVTTGVPVSRMENGRWAGTTVISKSGAFGDAGLLGRLISSAF
jgi:uncharacterized protein YgbK (DUF1537 family)